MNSLQRTALELLDQDPAGLRAARAHAARCDSFRGPLETVRLAAGLTRPALISRLGVSQQNYQQLCRRLKATSGAVRIRTLRKVAEALGCEVVVLLVPKSGDSFAQLAPQQRESRAGYMRETLLRSAASARAPKAKSG